MVIISNSEEQGSAMARELNCRFSYVRCVNYPDSEESIVVAGVSDSVNIIHFLFDKERNFNEQLFELFCILRQYGDKEKAHLILPYLPYLRSFPIGSTEVDVLALIFEMFQRYARNVYLLHPHNIEEIIREKRVKNIVSLNIDRLIIDYLKSLGKNVMLVSADEGFLVDVQRICQNGAFDFVCLKKKRISPTEVVLGCDEMEESKIKENKENIFVLLDDMVSTGSTIIQSGEYLRLKGVQDVRYVVVHNVARYPLPIQVLSSNSLIGKNEAYFDIVDELCASFLEKEESLESK